MKYNKKTLTKATVEKMIGTPQEEMLDLSEDEKKEFLGEVVQEEEAPKKATKEVIEEEPTIVEEPVEAEEPQEEVSEED